MANRILTLKNDSRWPKLEKVWIEERLTVVQLAERFGISRDMISRHLIDKYGTASSAKYHGEKRSRGFYPPMGLGD